jgi:predicted MFS family arabinose efflux permease
VRYAAPEAEGAGRLARTLAILSLLLAADTALYGAIAPLLPSIAGRFDLSKADAGLLVAAYPIGMAVSAIPMGFAAGRDGGPRTLLFGLGLLAVSSASFGLAGSAALLTGARVAQGVGGAAIWAGALMWLTGFAPPERRGAVIGIAFGAGLAGQVAGPALGAVAAALGPTEVFCAFAIAVACAAVPICLLPRPRRAAAVDTRRVVRLSGHRLAGGAFTLGLLVPSIVVGALEVLMPLRLHDLGAGDAAIGVIFVVMSLVTAAASPIVGGWSDRCGPMTPIRWGIALAIPLALALSLPASIAVYTLLGSMLWLAVVTSWTPAIAQLSALAESVGANPGVVWGLSNLVLAGGLLLGSAGGGALAGAAGDGTALRAAAGLLAVTIVVLQRLGPAAEAPAS